MSQRNLPSDQKATLRPHAKHSEQHANHHKKHGIKQHSEFSSAGSGFTAKMKLTFSRISHPHSKKTKTPTTRRSVAEEQQGMEGVANVDGADERNGLAAEERNKKHHWFHHRQRSSEAFTHGSGMPDKMKKKLGGS